MRRYDLIRMLLELGYKSERSAKSVITRTKREYGIETVEDYTCVSKIEASEILNKLKKYGISEVIESMENFVSKSLECENKEADIVKVDDMVFISPSTSAVAVKDKKEEKNRQDEFELLLVKRFTKKRNKMLRNYFRGF